MRTIPKPLYVEPASAGVGAHSYVFGDVIPITATPAAGFSFVRWNTTGDAQVANPTATSTTMTVWELSGTLCPQFSEGDHASGAGFEDDFNRPKGAVESSPATSTTSSEIF